MNREEYFSFLRDTTESVKPVLEKFIKPYSQSNKELYDILMVFTESRLSKPLQKPALFRLAYELCGGKEWEKVIPAAIAFELINISSYQANSAFDNKLGVLTKQEKDSQFIASMISRELSFKAASAIIKDYGEQFVTKLYSSLSTSNYHIYLAQHYDLNLLNMTNIEKYINRDLFERDYLLRCHHGSGIINGQCAYMGGYFAQANENQLSELRNFGENFGTGLQMVNDLADFVPEEFDGRVIRQYQDQYNDLKNGRLTYPLYLLLTSENHQVSNKTKEILKNKDFHAETLLEVTSLLVTDTAYKIIRKKTTEIIKSARVSIKTFKRSLQRDMLNVMTTVITSNKYLHALRSVQDYVRASGDK